MGLEVLVAVGAAGGSVGLMGGGVDASSYVDRLPFASPVFGGAALGLLVALPAAIAAVATLARRPWSRDAHLVVGALLMGWIVVQVGFIGLSSWLQPVMFVWGAAIAVLGWLDRRRQTGP